MSDNVYLGNPNLKKANTPIEFTQEQILNLLSVKTILFILQTTIKIVSLDEGLVPFQSI
jgi:hypothetical protein